MTKKKKAEAQTEANTATNNYEQSLLEATELYHKACKQADLAAKAQVKAAVALRDAGQAAVNAQDALDMFQGITRSYAEEEASINRSYTSAVASARRQAKHRQMVALARWFPATQD